MKIAFTTEVFKANDPNQKGQFLVVVFALSPLGHGRTPIAEKIFNTEKQLDDELLKFTQDSCHKFLESFGLDPEKANKVELKYDDEAIEAEKQYFNNNNPSLH